MDIKLILISLIQDFHTDFADLKDRPLIEVNYK